MATPKKAAAKKGATKAPAEKPTALVKAKSTDVASPNAELFGGVAGLGTENVTSSDLIIPRIGILQKLSPQLDEDHALYIEGAEEGTFCNIGMSELIETPMRIVPCYYIKQWLEWAPRKSGKGLQGVHASKSVLDGCKKNDKGQWVVPKTGGNYIVETGQLFVLLVNEDGERRRAFIPFTSTQLKKMRQLMTHHKDIKLRRADGTTFNPPLFFKSYLCETVAEKNNEGSWMGWVIQPDEIITELPDAQGLYEDALNFTQQCIEGQAKADHSNAGEEAGAYGGGDDANTSDDDDM